MDITEIILRKIRNKQELEINDINQLLENKENEEIYSFADQVRKEFCGDNFDTCSICNARSGMCSEDCKWCAQASRHNTGVQKYEIVETQAALNLAMDSETKGVKRFSLVTSGRTLTDSQLDNILKIYSEVKTNTKKIELCTSLGLLTKPQLEKLKAAGIKRYHCNLETAPSYFSKVCTTHTVEDKIETINYAKSIGLEICCGGIIGMGETQEQRIELAFAVRKLGADSIPVNILMPIKGTPLENQSPLSNEEILLAMSLFRIINPDSEIRLAGGRILIQSIQDKVLKCGVNSSIVGDLLTTVGSGVDEDMENFKKAGFIV